MKYFYLTMLSRGCYDCLIKVQVFKARCGTHINYTVTSWWYGLPAHQLCSIDFLSSRVSGLEEARSVHSIWDIIDFMGKGDLEWWRPYCSRQWVLCDSKCVWERSWPRHLWNGFWADGWQLRQSLKYGVSSYHVKYPLK